MQKLTDAQDLIAEARKLDAAWLLCEEVSTQRTLDVAVALSDALEAAGKEIERLKGLVGCGCGICLAHNGMRCPKMTDGAEPSELPITTCSGEGAEKDGL